METATTTALSLGAHIVNEPWGCDYSGCIDRSYFHKKGVTYVGMGVIPQPEEIFPADFDSVVAAGGTYLTKGGGEKRGWTDTEWQRAGGGCFTDVPKPKWQQDFSCSGRVSNDISIVGNNIGAYDSFHGLGSDRGWIKISGTSISSSLIAGIFGLAGNAKNQNGGKRSGRRGTASTCTRSAAKARAFTARPFRMRMVGASRMASELSRHLGNRRREWAASSRPAFS